MEKISFYQEALAKNIFLGDEDDPIFPIFSPCPFWPSVATERDRKQFQCLNIVLHNKTGP